MNKNNYDVTYSDIWKNNKPIEKNFNLGKKTLKNEVKHISQSIYQNNSRNIINEINMSTYLFQKNNIKSSKKKHMIDNNIEHLSSFDKMLKNKSMRTYYPMSISEYEYISTDITFLKTHQQTKKMKNLIIIDWDDTLFPTSWILKNNINIITKNYLNNENIVKLIEKLDIVLYKLLELMISIGTVIIITNATTSWIKQCCSILSKSNEIIKKNIDIISANDNYSKKYPLNISMWKKKEFDYQVFKYLKNNGYISLNNIDNNIYTHVKKINDTITKNNKIIKHSILSIGDSNYEYNALINLYDITNNIVNLKTIRFKQDISIEIFIDQLKLLRENIVIICEINNHADFVFLNKKL